MSIKGNVQTTKTNDWGFTSYKVSSTWYGADSKGPARAAEGDFVEFEAFDKPGKEGKVYPTIKLATFKKVSTSGPVEGVSTGVVSAKPAGITTSNAGAGSRDTYWADKATEDAKRDPRIVYQSSYERAINFTDLAIRNECFEALKKAKPTSRLEVLQAFVDEQAARIMKQVYTAEVPKINAGASVVKGNGAEGKNSVPAPELESDDESSWA